jgi:microcin C transport system substrate-binding protein
MFKTVALSLLYTASLLAGSSISLYGTPKYDDNFTHFKYSNPSAPKGGDIILGVGGTFDSFNPFVMKGISADDIELIYDTLLVQSLDEVSSYYGVLAEDINVSEDYKSVIFTLRDNIKFSDGETLHSDDVKFTFETLLKDGSPPYKSYLRGVKSVKALDKKRVKFIFKDDTNRDMVATVGSISILPQHFWKDRDFKTSSLEIPVGSGAYKIESFKAGHSVTFKRRDNYWGKNLAVNIGKYNFDSIKYDYYRDENVLFEAFKSLNYHFRHENISKNWATEYQNLDNRFVVEEIKHQLPQGIQGFFFNTRRDKFQDKRVREAIALAFDFEWTNRNLFYGQYKRSESFFSNSDFGYKDFQLPKAGGSYEIRPSLRKAMKLLKEAGCYLESGKLHFKDGKRVKFEMLLYSNGFVRVTLPFQRNLKKLGIDMGIRLVDLSQYIQRLRKFQFDMVIGSRGQSLIIGGEQFSYWHSTGADVEGSMNIAGVKNDKIDRAIKKITSSNSLEELYGASQELDYELLTNFYTVPHWHIDKFRVAYWKQIKRPEFSPPYGLNFNFWWFE